jgi:Ca-activated chloride channel homolog
MNRTICIVCLSFALVLVQASTDAIGNERNPIGQSMDRLSQDPVIVKVVVLNEATASLTLDLKAEDFLIEENGERQKPTRFLREEQPLSILLMIDSSGSMRPSIQMIIEALSIGLKRLKPDDEVALMSFNEKVDILQDFTKNKPQVENKLREVVAQRPTLTGQALLLAATHVLRAAAPDNRRVIVVLTDNRPSTPSDKTPERIVMQQLSASGSVVSGIIVPYPPLDESFRIPKSPTDITLYVDETGGLVETVKNFTPQEISARFVKTIDSFRNYYRIEYNSTNLKRDGKRRKIKVTLSPEVRKSRGKQIVLSRRSYYAPNDLMSPDQK